MAPVPVALECANSSPRVSRSPRCIHLFFHFKTSSLVSAKLSGWEDLSYSITFRLILLPIEKHLSLKIMLWDAFLSPEVTCAMWSVTGPFY